MSRNGLLDLYWEQPSVNWMSFVTFLCLFKEKNIIFTVFYHVWDVNQIIWNKNEFTTYRMHRGLHHNNLGAHTNMDTNQYGALFINHKDINKMIFHVMPDFQWSPVIVHINKYIKSLIIYGCESWLNILLSLYFYQGVLIFVFFSLGVRMFLKLN